MTKPLSRFTQKVIKKLDQYRTFFLDNMLLNPQDFSWKVRWRMRYDRNPVFIEIQDKYKVKLYAQSHGVRTAETYYVTDHPESIPFDSLPENYVIKATHGCGWNVFCKDGKLYLFEHDDPSSPTRTSLTQDDCIQLCHAWLKSTYSKKQWAYQHIVPQIVVEEQLHQHGGGALIDYRFYTFDGKVEVIQFDSSIYRENESVFFNKNWQEIELSIYRNRIPGPIPAKPENLQEMINTAEKLGEGIDFVRVDLYNTTRGVVLGEMTIYPEAGMLNRPTVDKFFNNWLGDQWILPESTYN